MRMLVRVLFFIACFVFARPAFALTAAGVAITNTSSVTFTDNSVSYSASSNMLTTYVQNVPVMTIGNPGAISVTPAYIGVDTFTLTNTGNNPGTFALTGDATFSGTATGTTLKGYVSIGGPGTCTIAAPCTLATLNSQSAMAGVAGPSGTASVGVEYQVNAAATVGQTVQPMFTANVTYAAGANTSAGASANVTVVPYSDTLLKDARLDVQTSGVISGANINWTVLANNGGGFAAQGLQSAKTVLGLSGSNGVALFMPVPSYPLGTTYLTVSSPSVVTAGAAGSSGTFYFNTGACSTAPVSGWTTSVTNAKCIAVFELNASATVLPSLTGGSSGVGAVSTAQITATFTTTQPTGAGSGVASSVTLLASSAIGGMSWATGAVPIAGQGLTGASQDAATASLLNAIQTNTTSSTLAQAPGGASNNAGSSATASLAFTLGPNPIANATGAWSAVTIPGFTSGTADNNHDFTFVDFDTVATGVNSAGNFAGAPSGGIIATGGTSFTVLGEISNTGNVDDVYDLTNNTIAGWTVAYYYVDCVTPLPSGFKRSVISGGNYAHCVKFTPPANVTAYSVYDFTITATSEWNSATNQTHDALYASGPLVAFRSYVVSACPGGVTPANNGVIPGCTITYTAYIVNEAPVAAAGGGTGNISVTPTTSAVVTENGSAGANTWGANTGGLTVAPTTANCALCTFTTISLGSKSFTVTIPIADLAPQARPFYTYSVLVN